MREMKNGACLELYMGELVDFNGNEKEEYQYGELRTDRYNPYTCMHYINDPIYCAHEKAYECEEVRQCNVKKKR